MPGVALTAVVEMMIFKGTTVSLGFLLRQMCLLKFCTEVKISEIVILECEFPIEYQKIDR